MTARWFEYYYRRRFLDKTAAITTLTGNVEVRRDDDLLVVEYPWTGPYFIDPITGRRGDTTITLTRSVPHAMRLWLWHDKPIRMMQHFDASGACILYRIDFATIPHQEGARFYQTDLYLDLFAKPDGSYAIMDEDELQTALALGLLSAQQHQQVLAQLDEITQALEAGSFQEWLGPLGLAPLLFTSATDKPDAGHSDYAVGQTYQWPDN